MRKNKETITLAKIRRMIRDCISWYKVDEGMPHFYNLTEDKWRKSKFVNGTINYRKHFPYYTKSDKVIEDRAMKILKLLKELK